MSYPPAPPPSDGVNPCGDDVFSSDPVPPRPERARLDLPPQAPAQPWSAPGPRVPPWQGGQAPWQPGPAGQAPWQPGPAGQAPPYLPQDAVYNPYGPSMYMMSAVDNRFGTRAMVLSLIGLFLGCVPLLGIGLGIGAVIQGLKGRTASLQGRATNRGAATAGVVIGTVSIVLGVVWRFGFIGSWTS